MKLGSLFDGSGGFPLAGLMCGIIPVWASEIEPYPIAVTKERFPYMKHLGDISRINGAEIEPVDIITFGSPCQDLSVAGKRAGLKHEAKGDKQTTRSGLFMEAVRIIKEMRCATNGKYLRFALWENVPGAFSSNKGKDFRIVLEELIKIVEPSAVMPSVPKKGWAYADSYSGDGWSLAYRVFDTQYWGVPQRRRRIHLVADFGGQCAREVLFEREGVRGYFTESGAEREEIAGASKNCAGTADESPCLIDSVGGQAERGWKGNIAPTLKATHYKTPPCVTVPAAYSIENHPADSRVNIDDSGKVQTLTSRMGTGGGNVPMVMEVERPVCYQQITGALCARDYKGVGNQYVYEDKLVIQQPQYIVRRLTPTECARLQGFPDKWGHFQTKEGFTDSEYAFWLDVRNTHAKINGKTVKEYTKKQMLSWYNKMHTDSAEYKMWGNGIALPPAVYCMQGIAETSIKGGKE